MPNENVIMLIEAKILRGSAPAPRALEFRHFARRRRERKVAPGGAQRHPGFISRGAFSDTATPGCARFP